MRRLVWVLTLAAATMVAGLAPAASSPIEGAEAKAGDAMARSGGGGIGQTGQIAFIDLVPSPTCTQLDPDTWGFMVMNRGTVPVVSETSFFYIQRPRVIPDVTLGPALVPTAPIPAGGSVDVLVAIPEELRRVDRPIPFLISVDAEDQVNESDETNNRASLSCPPTGFVPPSPTD
jgi:hypothetical protein